jgi:transposase
VDQKRDIVAESLGPDLTPTQVARKYAISSGQLYTWRRQLLIEGGSVVERAVPRFAAVELTRGEQPSGPVSSPASPPCASEAVTSSRPEGMIEIILPGGISVRMDAQVDGRALRRVLGALDGR